VFWRAGASLFEQGSGVMSEFCFDECLCGVTDPVHVHLELVGPGEFATKPADEVLVAGEICGCSVLVAQDSIGGLAATAVSDVIA
jgi:hypothetical protein